MESIGMPAAAEVAETVRKYGFSIATRVAMQADATTDEHELLVQTFYNLHARPAGHADENAFVELYRAATRLALGNRASEFRGQDGEALFVATLERAEGLREEEIAKLLGLPRRAVAKQLERFRSRATRLESAGDARLQRLFEPPPPSEPERLVNDLEIERYLIDDLDERQRRDVHARLQRSATDRARLDLLLKQRLIYLADNPPKVVAEQVAELLAVTPIILPERRVGRRAAIPAAAVLAVGLLAAGLISRAAASDEAVVALAAGVPATSVEPAAVAAVADAAATPEVPSTPTGASLEATDPPAPGHATAPEPKRADPLTRLIVRARSDGTARVLSNGDRVATSDRVIPWVELGEPGFVGVIGVRDDGRARVYSSDANYAVKLAAGGPTRVGRPRPPKPVAGETRERFLLLYSDEPFELLPIVRKLRHSKRDIADLFGGVVRSIEVRVTGRAQASESEE
jgi:hypothetical protein